MSPYLFIVGAPRSGTTLTGEILDSHPKIRTWFVPYFIWEARFRDRTNDVLTARDANSSNADYMRESFRYFKSRNQADYVIDQSPRNSLRIPFINAVFKGAKFIHVHRNPKDSILSIHKKWKGRMGLYSKGNQTRRDKAVLVMDSFRELIQRQPLLKHKLQAVLFEVSGFSLSNPEKHYNRRRWNGKVGWGPRFDGWQAHYDKRTLLEFNTLQWIHCETRGRNSLPEGEKQVFDLQYETLLDQPHDVVARLLKFVNPEFRYDDLADPPVLIAGNYNKWQQYFNPLEVEEMDRLLAGAGAVSSGE